MTRTALVDLVEVLKEQSFPKNGVRSYKCRLLNRGSELLRSLSTLYRDQDPEKKIILNDQTAPLGGAWGQAAFVIIYVPEAIELAPGTLLSAAREEFPKLNQEGEFYLSDILKFRVIDEFQDSQGVVEGFFFDLEKVGSPVNLRISDRGGEYECPLEWIDRIDWESKTLVIGGVYRWKSF